MMRKALISFLLTFFTLTGAFAQQYLYIKKKHAPPALRLALYQDIKFRTGDDRVWVEGIITDISTKHIGLNHVLYDLNDISEIRVTNRFLKAAGSGVASAGVLYVLISSVNQIINFRRPLLTEGQIIASGAMVGSGVLMRLLSQKTYRKEDGYIWEVIDFQNLIDE